MARRCSLVGLLLLAAVVACVLAGCDKLWSSDGYTWKRVTAPAASYSWSWMPECMAARPSRPCADAINNVCGYPYESERWGCSKWTAGGHCRVASIYSEAEARAVKMNGRSHFDHEVGPLLADGKTPDPAATYGHCAGLSHPEKHVRGT